MHLASERTISVGTKGLARQRPNSWGLDPNHSTNEAPPIPYRAEVPSSVRYGWKADIRDHQQFRLGRDIRTSTKASWMWHDDPQVREAFRRGAREAFDSCAIRMDARQKIAVTQWLDELEEWDEGEPPVAPIDW